MKFRALVEGTFLAALLQLGCAVTVTDIQGASWLSPLQGQTVHNLSGIVTAKVRIKAS